MLKRRVFVQDDPPISEADRAALREALVPAMISLSNAADKAVRAQVAESISLIAKVDFPEGWPDLVDVSNIHILCAPSQIPERLFPGHSETRRVTVGFELRGQHWHP